MKEITEIIKAYEQSKAAGKRTALASVVHKDGSSYRRPGARMLVDDEGQLTGAISGGCLEGDALRKALLVIAQQYSKLVTYDTTGEDDISAGVQLGCAGVIQVLFEPIDIHAEINPVKLLQKAVSRRQQSVLVTLFCLEEKNKPQPGTCLLLEEDGTITGDVPVKSIKENIMLDVKWVMGKQFSSFKNYPCEGITYSAFIEFLPSPVSLVVAGAGNDAIPLVKLAEILGWETRVVDGRNTHAKQERFSSACQVLVSKPEQVLEQIPIDKQTVFVLMTHNYNYDLALLKALMERQVTYIGVLGPAKKLEKMIDELTDQGMKLTDELMHTVYGPVGLDIGAETPEEIALSIIAEIKTVLEGRKGLSLRDSKKGIHI